MNKKTNYNFHVHKLVEALLTREVNIMPCEDEDANSAYAAYFPILARVIRESSKFNMGHLKDLVYVGLEKAQEEDMKLPYKICYFEGTANVYNNNTKDAIANDLTAMILAIQEDEGVRFVFFRQRFDKKGFFIEPFGLYKWNHSAMRVSLYPLCKKYPSAYIEKKYTAEMISEALGSYFSQLMNFLCLLNTQNASTEIISAPIALNKKREKNKKLPLYEYKILNLDIDKEKHKYLSYGEHQSNERNKPRIHYRRGHYRNCHTGKRVWVKACLVGNEELGVIRKDYSV